MASVKCTLKQGLKTVDAKTAEEIMNLEAELREVTAGDLIDAAEESERLVLTPEGNYQLVTSPTLTGLHCLRRQIVRIGEHPGPLTLGELRKLSGADLNLLNATAASLENATLEDVAKRGRDSETQV
jgi:phage FluMu protein gp41